MFVNLDKFHAIIVKRNNIRNDSYPLNTNQDVINWKLCEVVEMDDELSISTLGKK